MTAEQLVQHLQSGTAPVVLDVRSTSEYASGHIPGAVHARLPRLCKVAGSVAGSKQDHLLLVCEHGPRAQLARLVLQLRGYRNLQLLEGHMSRWRGSRRPLQTG